LEHCGIMNSNVFVRVPKTETAQILLEIGWKHSCLRLFADKFH
jgi:hypothetical protein